MNREDETPLETPPRSPGRNARIFAAAALAYFLAHWISFLVPDAEKVLMAIWPAGGIGLAVLLLNPRRLWPPLLAALFVSGILADFLIHRPLAASFGFMCANILESWSCAWLITRWCGGPVRFERVREVVALLVASTLLNAATALLGAAAAVMAVSAPFWMFWRTWWVSDGLGLLLVAPLIVAWARSRPRLASFSRPRALEITAFMIFWCAACWISFRFTFSNTMMIPHPYMLVALLAWPALRLGPKGVTSALIVLAVIVVTGHAVRIGPILWGAYTLEGRLLMGQVFIGFAAVTGFLLAASYAEARRAECTARASEARYDELVRRIPVGVYTLRIYPGGRKDFEYFSPRAHELIGSESGGPDFDITFGYEACHPEDRDSLIQANTEGERLLAPFKWEGRFIVHGAERWIRLESEPVALPGGGSRWNGVMIDVTERRLAEESLRQSQAELERSRHMEAIGRLAGGVAHDLNNMLTPIMGYGELVLESLPEQDERRHDLDSIIDSAARAGELVRHLLAYAGRQPIVKKPLDLNRVIAGLEPELRRALPGNVTLQARYTSGLCAIHAGTAQLEQILLSLAAYAGETMPAGGVLAIETAEAILGEDEARALEGLAPGPHVTLSVHDTGAGLDEESLRRIFEPFFTRKDLAQGHGLGLAAIQGALRQIGAAVRVTSTPGQGTHFLIFFPCEGLVAPAAASPRVRVTENVIHTRSGIINVVA